MRTFLLICLASVSACAVAQQTLNDTIMHDGLQRAYILYVPASYTPGNPAPLVMNFHGYTSTSWQQMVYGDFRAISDSEGFLLVHPMGSLDINGQSFWNSGWGAQVDDIGFTAALIDSLSAEYSINPDRVYCTGMSNGGFMSYTLSCELSTRFAAMASVTGTMNSGQIQSCDPQHTMPVMEIHGTADPTVPYAGSGTMQAISDVLDYWIGFDHCDTTPVITEMPDVVTTDGCTATHLLYQNGDNGVEVEHYRINNGEHSWPGAIIDIAVTNHDINASALIWEFFNKYDMNGRRAGVGIETTAESSASVRIFPNPSSSTVSMEFNGTSITSLRILNVLGAEVRRLTLHGQKSVTLALDGWSDGVYFIEANDKNGRTSVSKWLIDN